MAAENDDLLSRFESQDTDCSNFVWHVDDETYFSYNPDPCRDGGIFFESDDGGTETAMVLDGKFYILNGDWRLAYASAFDSGGISACVELFARESQGSGSTWTTGSDLSEFLAKRLKLES